MILRAMAIIGLLLAGELGAAAQVQEAPRPQPQSYFAVHTDRPTRGDNRRPYSAMEGGFAGSSSARDVAHTFGY